MLGAINNKQTMSVLFQPHEPRLAPQRGVPGSDLDHVTVTVTVILLIHLLVAHQSCTLDPPPWFALLLQNLTLELATMGDLKLVERLQQYTLAPGASKVIRANIKVGYPVRPPPRGGIC
jgi:hypothetical protein